MDIEIELTKGIFFLEVVFPSTKAHFDLNSPLMRCKKSLTFWIFYWLMSCALARWFQKCIYVHSKYCSKWIEIVKRKGRRPLGRKCLFWPTCSNICYGHVYIFGISVPRRCWWANKKRKKFNFFSRPIRGEFKSKWALVEGKTTSSKFDFYIHSGLVPPENIIKSQNHIISE